MTTAMRFAAASAVVLVLTAGLSAGKQDFVLVNQTGTTIAELYVSPSDTDDWEEDVLGQDVLEPGQSVKVRFATGESQCDYDLKVNTAGGDELVWTDIDLCEASTVTLKPKGLAEIK